MSHITTPELALWQRSEFPHTLIDVRRALARQTSGSEIAGGHWEDPALWLDWKDTVPADRIAVLYCAHGHELSQGLVAALCAMGLDARYLDGGIDAWKAAGEPVIATSA